MILIYYPGDIITFTKIANVGISYNGFLITGARNLILGVFFVKFFWVVHTYNNFLRTHSIEKAKYSTCKLGKYDVFKERVRINQEASPFLEILSFFSLLSGENLTYFESHDFSV